jgi:hypothetical protein
MLKSRQMNGAGGWAPVWRGALLAVALCAAGGCNTIDNWMGPEPTKAMYKPKKDLMVIMVENPQHEGRLDTVSDELATDLTQLVKQNKVAPVVPYAKLMEFRTRHSEEYPTMAIPTVGRAVDAKQVLYVNLKEAHVDVSPGTDYYSIKLDVRIKLVDVTTGETVWPQGTHDGYPIKAEEPVVVRTQEASGPAVVQSAALENLAEDIANCFREYLPDEKGPLPEDETTDKDQPKK